MSVPQGCSSPSQPSPRDVPPGDICEANGHGWASGGLTPLVLQGPVVVAAFPIPPCPHCPASAPAPNSREGRMFLWHQPCDSCPHPVLFCQGWAASFSLQLPCSTPYTHHHF